MAHGTNSVNYVSDATDADTNDGILYGNGRLVLTGTIPINNDGSTLTTASKSHNLGFVPNIIAVLENSTVTIVGGSATGASINLPIFLSASIGGVTTNVVTFGIWLYAFADSTKIYVNMLNATGTATSANITYYLYQQRANS